jgi:hypothetical protein
LIIAINKKNEIVFVVKTKSILGCTVDQATKRMCGGNRNLVVQHLNEIDQANSGTYTKAKCQNGDYKYIQWNDKKFSEDLIIGIGQDVTEHVKTQKGVT